MGQGTRDTSPYEIVVGLEVHLQLATATKLFCGCPAAFGAPPNSQVCPVCLGLPGVLPVLNARAYEWGIRVACALHCTVAPVMKFDRKQYFYPDLPKNYQISQFDQPLAANGWIEIGVPPSGGTPAGSTTKRVRIRRAHLEEDAGKLLHEGQKDGSLVDFNRAGVPLLEIVSEPDLRSADEAYEYCTALKAALEYLDVSTCDMEKGSLRCDTNVSLRRQGETALGAKVEVKNLNSFKAVKQAIEYEAKRQAAALDAGQRIPQETRLWDAKQLLTESMRSKEEAADYRYFPEPDLVPFHIEPADIERIRAALPESPSQRRARFARQYELSPYDAQVLTQERALAELFEQAVQAHPAPKPVANWLTGDFAAYLKTEGKTVVAAGLRPAWLAHLLQLMDDGTISGKMAKELFVESLRKQVDPAELATAGGLRQIVDTGALESLADRVIQEFPKSVEDYRKGKANALMFLVGQAMKRSQGKANPQQMSDTLKRRIESLKPEGAA